MSNDISNADLDNMKQMMQDYIDNFNEIDEKISDLLKNSSIKARTTLEEHPEEIQNVILENRDKVLSMGFIAISTIALIIRRFHTASKLVSLFTELINRFVSLITRYEGLFKIHSIQVTISLTPSIVIIFKP